MNLSAAQRFFESHHAFVLAAHRSPDGDTLGSCLALRLALMQRGKQAVVACVDPVPPYLRFLPGSETVVCTLEKTPEAVCYIDCADHARTDALQPILEQAPHQFCIDHHGTNPKTSVDGDWVEPVAATGELIARLCTALGVPLTEEIATCLYTAVATDTGNFSFANTTPDTFRTAAELLQAGVRLPELNRRLFRTKSVAKGRLIAHTLNAMQLYENEALAVACITREDFARCGAEEADCEGLIDYLRDLEPVEIACTLRESADGGIRVSLRSKKGADVSAVAALFGGGGHRRAAGCTLDGPMESALARLLPLLKRTVNEWTASSTY